MTMEGKKAIITGANGFIGSWLCRKLLEKGAAVTGLVHGGSEGLQAQGIEGKVETVNADIRDAEALKKIFSESRPELCFHLAAASSTRTAAKDLAASVETNVVATMKVLEAARSSGTAVCFASSGKVYGGDGKAGFGEDAELLGNSAYATSKICGEAACKMYARAFGLNAAIARMGNVYGWGDFNQQRLVPKAVQSVLRSEKPWVCGKGESEFDFVFVGDAANAFLAIGEKMLQGKMNGKAFNIATGKSTSIRAVAEKIIQLVGNNVEIDFSGEEKVARERLLIEKAGKALGWKPEYDLERGLLETIEWYKKRAK